MNNAFRFVSTICRESFIQPGVVSKRMRKNVNLTLIYQDKIWTRILLERLADIGVGTNDAQNHAFKQVKMMNKHNICNKVKHMIEGNM